MKEQMVANLEEVDIKEIKELEQRDKLIRKMTTEYASQAQALWEELKTKYNLSREATHYIRDNVIYKQVIEKGG